MTQHKHKTEHYSAAPNGTVTETCKCGAVQRTELRGKTRISSGWKRPEELAAEVQAQAPAKQDRVHLYYPVEDQEILQRTVRLSQYDSASSLVRELVRRHYKQLCKKAADECDQ